MPQATFTETRAALELKLQDALANVKNLNDWHAIDWNDILDIVKHVGLELETAQELAGELEKFSRSVLATNAYN